VVSIGKLSWSNLHLTHDHPAIRISDMTGERRRSLVETRCVPGYFLGASVGFDNSGTPPSEPRPSNPTFE
jgi:hypothetical protein